MLGYLLLALMGLSAVMSFVGFVRASRFALKHKDSLGGIVGQSAWWLKLLEKDAYGAENDAERRKMAVGFFAPLVLTFVFIGLVYLMAAPVQG